MSGKGKKSFGGHSESVIPENLGMAKRFDQYVHEGIKRTPWRACKRCGEKFYSGFKYWTCKPCADKLHAQYRDYRGRENIEAGAILAIERRKAEIKAAKKKTPPRG